jgi:hypothetical protein
VIRLSFRNGVAIIGDAAQLIANLADEILRRTR